MLKLLERKIKVLLLRSLRPIFEELSLTSYKVYGCSKRLRIHETAKVSNALFNTYSGEISIDSHSFAGHNVSFLTGSHDYRLKNLDRMFNIPTEGRDICIGKGVWIGSNSTILGPCTIGDNSVVAAGSVVVGDITANSLFGGTPAKLIKKIEFK
jgi:acetyltransferase-like isoleucine patch superfamily enzyme